MEAPRVERDVQREEEEEGYGKGRKKIASSTSGAAAIS